MAMNLDLAKAYDKVSWEFLEILMKRMGFCDYWVNLIMCCVSSATLAVMVNGEETGIVRPRRGLRQGDPLSPYLFNFVANVLSNIIEEAEDAGAFIGYKINRRCPTLSHLLFADDCIIFAMANEMNAVTILDVLKLFQDATGQTVNFSKSSIFFSPNTKSDVKENIMAATGIALLDPKAKYLGLPIIWGRGKKMALNFLREKVTSRIKSWKGRFLSAAGREILIKAVVSAMPVNVMQLFKIPKTFCKELNVVLNKFWWGGVDSKQYSLNWMAWDKIAIEKSKGGMGFRDFQAFNLALLAKQAWRLINNPEAKWVRLLKAIYFPTTDPLDAVPKKGSWGWNSLLEGLQFILKGMRWNIGNGEKVSIWDDKWIPSKASFKVNISRPPNLNLRYVKDLMHADENRWNEDIIRNVFGDEDNKAILSIPLGKYNNGDKLIWHHASNGIYSAKIGYHMKMKEYNQINQVGTSSQLNGCGMNWNSIWNLNCLPKIKHFIWKACHNVVPTNEAMARRHHSRQSGCNRCGNPMETLEHVLFFCHQSRAVWQASCFNYSPSEIGFESFAKWWITMVNENKKHARGLDMNLLASTVWGIWKTRNRAVFENEMTNPIDAWLLIDKQHNEFLAAANTVSNTRTSTVDRRNEGGWEPPENGVIKINCDAAFLTSSCSAGIVAVARNSEGVVVGGSNEQVVSSSAFVAECLALRLGSLLAEQHGWTNVEIETDCKNAVEMANGVRRTTWNAEVVIKDIMNIISCNRNFVIKHVGRNRNRLADWLARSTLRDNCPHDWTTVMPIELHNVINAV